MDTITVDLGLDADCLPLTFRWVSPGEVAMSNVLYDDIGDDVEINNFKVVLTRGFWLGIYPITLCQWQAIMGDNPIENVNISPDSNIPVMNISWYDAINFCDKLTARPIPKPQGYTFSLPTEVQWEYACRAGTEYQYQIGDSLDDLSQVAWHHDNTDTIQAVGQKTPNNWGFYDMLGNVGEMCFDGSYTYPDGCTVTDWIGDWAGQFPYRVTRGGCFLSNAVTCRSYMQIEVEESYYCYGFRVCLRFQEENESER